MGGSNRSLWRAADAKAWAPRVLQENVGTEWAVRPKSVRIR
jgi:hypothetical protein